MKELGVKANIFAEEINYILLNTVKSQLLYIRMCGRIEEEECGKKYEG